MRPARIRQANVRRAGQPLFPNDHGGEASKMWFRRSLRSRFLTLLNYSLLILLCLVIVIPFWYVIVLSFNGGKDTAMGGVAFWPRAFTVNNYVQIFTDKNILQGYGVTLFRTALGTALSVLCTAMAAYGLKCKEMPGHKLFTSIIVFTMLFGGNAVAYYIVLRTLKLPNTIWVYIIPGLYSAWNIILVRSFFETQGQSLEDAATVDGAGVLRIFFQIALPLAKPVIAVIALYNAVGQWSDWFAGAFYITDRNLRPVATILQQMLVANTSVVNQAKNSYQALNLVKYQVTGDSLKMAMVIVTMAPVMLMYPFIQKYFTSGIMLGAIKG